MCTNSERSCVISDKFKIKRYVQTQQMYYSLNFCVLSEFISFFHKLLPTS